MGRSTPLTRSPAAALTTRSRRAKRDHPFGHSAHDTPSQCIASPKQGRPRKPAGRSRESEKRSDRGGGSTSSSRLRDRDAATATVAPTSTRPASRFVGGAASAIEPPAVWMSSVMTSERNRQMIERRLAGESYGAL